ncbi:hypothetical protein [Thioalkalivibrio sp.]|uniref:hypothetical protein n=1 Tax=Thioalkalivibrio sp. TaxID=2093813 RepID=UPI00397711A6
MTVTAASLLPRLVSLLLLLAVAVLAARLTWQVIEPDVRPPVTMEIRAERATPVDADARRSPLDDIAELPLFGVPGSASRPLRWSHPRPACACGWSAQTDMILRVQHFFGYSKIECCLCFYG